MATHTINDGITLESNNYCRPFISAMTFPQLVSESSVIALLFAVFSMQSGQATSSLIGVRFSAAGEMIVPISRPHILHVMLSGKDIEHGSLFYSRRPNVGTKIICENF